MTSRLSELFTRLDNVNKTVNQKYGMNLITAIEEHQQTRFYERHLTSIKDAQEQALLSFYSDIVNQGLDSQEVLKTSKKIELVEKTLSDKTPITLPLQLHVLISELNVSIAEHISTTSKKGTSEEIHAFLNMPEDYTEKREEIVNLLDDLSQYIIQLVNDKSKVRFLKKSRLLFKTLGLGYFYRFITDYLALIENVSNISTLNETIIRNELGYLEAIAP